MIYFDGYEINEKIYESHYSAVYRGYRQRDKQAIILKVLTLPHPTPEKIAWFKREHELTHRLDLGGVIKNYGVEYLNNYWVMVLEDFGGESLNRLDIKGNLDLADFLKLAIDISHILGQIHHHKLIHKDINPANIVLNPETKEVKLIDFGIASHLNQENAFFGHPHNLQGTLAYISPEQTGRMNRSLDYRSDLYSLGVTFYELLSGQRPFSTTDVMSLVHAHIAKPPPPLKTYMPDIPAPIAEIIAKLMSKNAEDRYQSAFGLKADLEVCAEQWRFTDAIQPFLLGEKDVFDHFQIPEKLYGREKELDILLHSFEGVNQGETRLLLIKGYPGIGKTALVQEIYKPITAKRGFFISGKFEQLNQNIPYQGFVEAFEGLIEQLLTASDAEIEGWRTRLQAALGTNGQIMVDLWPNLGLIIGPQVAVPDLMGGEAENRLSFVVQNFVSVFAQKEHPLVLFIDDLQWVDVESLKLLKLLLTAEDMPCLFIIGAYRDNEVRATDPLQMLFINKLAALEIKVETLSLGPLKQTQVNHLVADTLKVGFVEAEPLSKLVFDKTQGNPFFVNEFLEMLYAEGLIRFDNNLIETERGGWFWNLAEIEGRNITANVADLMVAKLQKLSSAVQHQLKLAACIGYRFDLETLLSLTPNATDEVISALDEAIEEGFIYPLDDSYKLLRLVKEMPEVNFKFLHDHVQEAAYQLIPPSIQKVYHLAVGQLLLSKGDLEHHIFDVVNHLNQAQSLIAEFKQKDYGTGFMGGRGKAARDERLPFLPEVVIFYQKLAELNLQAGQKAKYKAAYAPALVYFKRGVEALPANCWGELPQLTFDLYYAQAEAEYLNGAYERSENIILMALESVKTAYEKAQLYNLLLIEYSTTAKYKAAIDLGYKALHLLGIDLPLEDATLANEAIMVEIERLLAGRKVITVLDMPPVEDKEKKLAMNILSQLASPLYYIYPNIGLFTLAQIVLLSLQYGQAPETGMACSYYTAALARISGNYEECYRVSLRAIDVINEKNYLNIKCNLCYATGIFINNHLNHLKESQFLLDEAYQAGLNSGNFQFAGYALMHKGLMAFYQGEPLSEILDSVVKFLPFVERTKNQIGIDALIGLRIILYNLTSQTSDYLTFNDDGLTEAQFLKECEIHKGNSSIGRYHVLKCQVLYLYGDYEMALRQAELAEKYIGYIANTHQVNEFKFYHSLCLTQLYSTVSPQIQQTYADQLDIYQEKMAVEMGNCPANFEYKYLLVEAERARLNEDDFGAVNLYQQAIASAKKYGFMQAVALAHEVTAYFWLDKGHEQYARTHLIDAHYNYLLWGATAKVKKLEEMYPYLNKKQRGAGVPHSTTTIDTTSSTILEEVGENFLDIHTLLKVSQAISEKIELDKLLVTLMTFAIENAGAEKGVLILDSNGELFIEAMGSTQPDSIAVQLGQPLKNSQQLPTIIVRYVVRTQETIILNDSLNDKRFNQDTYLQKHQPKSILCLPLINQGKLIGVLYLENNLTSNAFRPDQLQLLKLLSSQAAIALEKANLYAHLAQNEQMMGQILEAMPMGILVFDNKGYLRFTNNQARNIAGENIAEINHLSEMTRLYQLYVGETTNRYPLKKLPLIRALLGESSSVSDIELRSEDKNIPLELWSTPIFDDNERIVYTITAFHDITKRKESEAKQLQLSALHHELTLAHEIQSSLLPVSKPDWPDLDMICYSLPAQDVGGDLYTYERFEEAISNQVIYKFALGDVSGKGMPAALLMAISLAAFQSLVSQNLAPHELLARLDLTIQSYTTDNYQNCAMVYVEIKPILKDFVGAKKQGADDGPNNYQLEVVNAGCIAPLIKYADGTVSWLDVGNLPLGFGLGAETGYSTLRIRLSIGDMIILTTDGMIEAYNKQREMFGLNRFEEMVAAGPHQSATAMLNHLKKMVNDFTDNTTQHDDISLMVIKL